MRCPVALPGDGGKRPQWSKSWIVSLYVAMAYHGTGWLHTLVRSLYFLHYFLSVTLGGVNHVETSTWVCNLYWEYNMHGSWTPGNVMNLNVTGWQFLQVTHYLSLDKGSSSEAETKNENLANMVIKSAAITLKSLFHHESQAMMVIVIISWVKFCLDKDF